MYIQNPPIHLQEQIKRVFGEENIIKEIHQNYNMVTEEIIRGINIEFDKAYAVFHSAFYQLFDEGIYEDQNYRVDVRHAIIICTSNYKSKDEIKEKYVNKEFKAEYIWWL